VFVRLFSTKNMLVCTCASNNFTYTQRTWRYDMQKYPEVILKQVQSNWVWW